MIKRFEREADLLGLLNHPGIAHVYAAGVTDLVAEEGIPPIRVPYIAMELVTGPTIAEYVIRAIGGRMNDLQHRMSAALPLIAQLCEAVHHAHMRGVIHRDLKPANVLVSEDFGDVQVKVLDFGVARLTRSDDAEPDAGAAPANPDLPAPPCDQPALTIGDLTGHGNLVGTLSYMSPEQVRLGSKIDARADVYSIGAVLYELLTGKTPIETCDCTLAEAAQRILHHLPEPLAAAPSDQHTPRPAIQELQRILDRSLAKDPADRFSSALEMATELRRLLAGLVTALHA
jgi:serine/threonine protein kinase